MSDFLSDADFELYRKLVYDASGIHFSATNRSILESRLKERLRDKKIESLTVYYQLLLSDKEELKTLLDSVTTNLTRFFRNQPHFDALEHYVVPELIKLKGNSGERKIRIWSAGCSTGEEPYTIAMLLKDCLPAPWSFEIVASDISLKSLMRPSQDLEVLEKSPMGKIPFVDINGHALISDICTQFRRGLFQRNLNCRYDLIQWFGQGFENFIG